MDKEQIIEKLWEDSNHGTWREDIEAAYSAGVRAERERCAKLCDDSNIFDYQDPGGFFAALIRGPGPNVL